jgi:hypothetical protein
MTNPAFKFDHVHIISENPKASADWYVEMFGAPVPAAPQAAAELSGGALLWGATLWDVHIDDLIPSRQYRRVHYGEA